jgi:uncharacterized damage-inducible protein DinB
MKAIDIILLSLEENEKYIQDALKWLKEDELKWSPKPHSNSIIFLLWHLARVEDLWIKRILQTGKDIYETGGWYKKFGTSATDTGAGYEEADLKAWPVPALKLVNEYKAAVRKTAVAYISGLTDKQLDEEKDFGWGKGTAGSALKHLICEVGEHAGQIGYIKGMMKGIEPPPDFLKKNKSK